MTKSSTAVEIRKFPIKLSTTDKIMILGSCFAKEMGSRMSAAGFKLLTNPFGTLYNPISIANSIARMDHCVRFRPEECVEMGAGAGKICSWWHHTSFARVDAEDFLSNANRALEEASAFWKESNKVIITLGTAMVWKLVSNGEVVSNCLKRPAREFSHEMLSVDQVSAVLRRIVDSHPEKEFIFTISPIRHMGEGAHLNTLSKATLHLGLPSAMNSAYFPAYEIMLDELRDYRWFAADLVHPSEEAADLIWERFRLATEE
ncbi:MAG: GSCFA domain-containing protein [Bacteroidales bacterium]|nr:GSCFA domain-containing protein [Bacteroidales bacterium]